MRIYLRTPRLRGLLALNLTIAAGSAMVIVNTVALVQSGFGLSQQAMALALAQFGGGSMLMAFLLPKLLDRYPDRRVMFAGGALIAAGMLVGPCASRRYETLLVLWFVLGAGYSMAQTPSGRLLRRSAQSEDRPALFAAQFALSHACWLVTYPLAGWLGATSGLGVSFVVLGILATASLFVAARLWPAHDPDHLSHARDELEPGIRISPRRTWRARRCIRTVVDDEHPRRPR